jgi:subtilisin family serine protease
MKRAASALVFFLILLSCASVEAQPLKLAPHRTGQILIKPRVGASSLLLQALHNTHGAAIARAFDRLGNIQLVRLPKNMTVEQAVTLYRANPLIEFAEPDYRFTINQTQTFPNDPSFNQLWGLHNTGQNGGTANADINAPEAWNLRTSANTIIVGVVDSGIDYNHPDLAANMWTNPSEIPNNGIDDDNNGYIDDVYGINAINNSGNPMDDNNHGTHVAGTIGAVGNNGVGVTGVAWNVKLMALKFLSADGSGSSADAIECINYSLTKGVHILNNSWGGGGFSQSLFNAINSAKDQGVIFVAAASNEGSDNDQAISYPSGFNIPNVVAVAATDRRDLLASYSNFGYQTVDLGAPGSSILSTTPNNTYSTFSGTSMATPQVSGALALLKAHFPALTYTELIRRLYLATDPLPALTATTFTGGRLNLFRALTSAQRPIPHLTLSTRGGAPPLTVTFTDTSIGNLTSRLLDVGAGGSAIALNGSTTHTYTAPGTYTATLSVSGPDGSASRSQVIRVQPPYTAASDTYRWIDTTGMTTVSLTDDGVSSAITLPFAFPFFGNQTSTAYISANGFITLGSPAGASQFENSTLPAVTSPNNAIYAFWDDLNPEAGGTIRYGVSEGSFVISWEDVPHFSAPTQPFSFQIVLNRWGGIQFNYREVRPGLSLFGGGRSATVGIEDDSGAMATLVSFNANNLTNSSSRRFTRGAITLGPTSDSAPAAGATGNITVTPTEPAFAAWTVSGQPAWLSVNLATNPHVWTATANAGSTSRTATLSIGPQTFTLTQSGSLGSVSLNPTSATAVAAGASGSITVTPTPSTFTTWNVTGNPAWLSITVNGATVNWTAQANNSVNSRTATLTIGDKSFQLTQSGATGSVTLSASSASAAAAGASGSVNVTPTPSDFSTWTVTGQTAWLTATASGNTVNWTAQANNSVTSRSATLSIGGVGFTVNQSGATGTVTLGATSATAAATGGSGSVTVTPSPADFTTWTVSTPPAWLTTTRTATSVSWTAQANDSVNSRSATLTIGDKTFNLTQSGATGSVSLSATSATAPAAGGSDSVTVIPSPADFTTWTVSTPPAWLTVSRTATAVSWTAQANNSVSARAATLTIGNRSYTVNQSGAAGSVNITPATVIVPSSGGSGSVTVIPTPADYNTWTVSGQPSWLTVSPAANAVSWTAQANNSINARSATVTIGDKTFTLNQSGVTGSLNLSASSASVAATGGYGNVTVTPTPADYNTWTVTGQPDWLTVTVAGNVVSWSAPAINSVNARTATLTIGDKTFAVQQSGATGTVSLSASSATAPPAGGSGSLTVTPSPADFTAWSVAGAPAWLTVTRTGNTVAWAASAINSVNSRSATLSIGDKTFTVTQSGAPGSIALSATSATVGAIGSSGSITITPTPSDYTGWTVTGAPQWLVVTLSANAVSWTAGANNSVSPRTATLTIDDKTFTLTQSGATGSVTLSPASASAPAAGITSTINVTPTPADFKSWTVSGQPNWLTITTTENAVTWTAAPNPSVSPRTATLAIGDKSFSLTQSGASGSVTLSPTTATAPAAGATGAITVTPTPADFTTWTVSGQPLWLTLSTAGNTITWTASANPSVSPRTATVTIGDKSFSLTQSGATGSVTLSPASATAPAGAATGSITITPTPTDFTTWSVSGQPAWLTISTAGNIVTWSATANTSVSPRTATLAIGDKSFSLTQSGATGSVALSPTAATAPAAGATGAITVTPTPADFTAWTVSGQPAWLTVSTAGNTITWAAAPNPSASPRTATLAIGDKSFSLTQSGAAGSVTLSAPSASAPAAGATGAITVTPTPADFTAWTVSGQPAWLTVSTTGNTVNWTAAPNPAQAPRTATLIIGDKTFTLTQAAAPPPVQPSATGSGPVSGAGASQTLTFQFSHPQGFQQLGVLNVLINTALDGGRACYIAYSQPAGVLFLVNDAGPDAGLSAPLTLGSSATVQNSQCTVHGAGSSAQGSGNTLTLTLRFTFSAAFTGSKVIYTAARDTATGNSGWQTLGASQIPEASPALPRTEPLSPATTSAATQTLTATYRSATGFTTAWLLINTAVNASQACYVAYFEPGNLLLLYPDNGDPANIVSMPLSGTNAIENSQCRITAQGSGATKTGEVLTLNLNVTTKPTFSGPKGIWTAMQSGAGQVSPWRISGNWLVP